MPAIAQQELHVGAEAEGVCVGWFKAERYGLVRVSGAPRDVVVSSADLVDSNSRSLNVGDRVRFSVCEDAEGNVFADTVAIIGVRLM